MLPPPHFISYTPLLIVHKDFLLNQWIERIKDCIPDARIGIIQGEKVIEAIKASGANEVLLVLEIFFPLAKNEEQILAM